MSLDCLFFLLFEVVSLSAVPVPTTTVNRNLFLFVWVFFSLLLLLVVVLLHWGRNRREEEGKIRRLYDDNDGDAGDRPSNCFGFICFFFVCCFFVSCQFVVTVVSI